MACSHLHKGIAALAVSLTASGTVLAVDDCCTATTTENNNRGEVLGNDFCASFWSSDVREVGKFCLPLGSGYACGIQNTLTVGQEFELRAGFSAGGASVEVATKYTVSQAFQHTAGNCQSCQLFASYSGAVLREWDVQTFYFYGGSQFKRTTFYTFGNAPTIMPCCETNNNCPGCPEGEPGEDSATRVAERVKPMFMARDEWGRSTSHENTYIIDLRVPWSFTPTGPLPPWHPMNSPGFELATLNCWQKHEIMREVFWHSVLQGAPLAELVIIDVDGSAVFFDLVSDPNGITPCPADLTCNGVLDLIDINLFVDYFLFGDPTVDFDFNGVLDLADVGAFTAEFVSGCP